MIRMRELSGNQLGKRIDPTGGIVVDGTIALTTANTDLDREKSFANVDYVRGAETCLVTKALHFGRCVEDLPRSLVVPLRQLLGRGNIRDDHSDAVGDEGRLAVHRLWPTCLIKAADRFGQRFGTIDPASISYLSHGLLRRL